MLFTVTATFCDFTVSYEQYEAAAPAEALAEFMMAAEALSGYDRRSRAAAAAPGGHKIVQVAGKSGLWIWHLTERLEQGDEALYGGCIVQTDRTGATRTS
jgi:hypothetical protein